MTARACGDRPRIATAPTVTVLVVTWQGAHLLPDCLDSLSAQTVPATVLVVDNASTDGTAQLLAARGGSIEVLRLATNTGFAGGIAAGLEHVRTPYVALLNNDAVADPAWLERSVAALQEHPRAAAITAHMLLWEAVDGAERINNAGIQLLAGGYGADRGLNAVDGAPYDTPVEVFGFSGGAAVLRTAPVRAVGGMPAEFFLYYEDADLSWRLRLAGWQVWYEPGATVRHRHGASTDLTSPLFAFHTERNRLLMLLRCAPIGFAATQLLRFALTTASLGLQKARGRPVATVKIFDMRLRIRVLAAVLTRLPALIGARRDVARRTSLPRRTVLQSWIGR